MNNTTINRLKLMHPICYQFSINNILIKRYNTASANMLRKQLKRANICFNELIELA